MKNDSEKKISEERGRKRINRPYQQQLEMKSE